MCQQQPRLKNQLQSQLLPQNLIRKQQQVHQRLTQPRWQVQPLFHHLNLNVMPDTFMVWLGLQYHHGRPLKSLVLMAGLVKVALGNAVKKEHLMVNLKLIVLWNGLVKWKTTSEKLKTLHNLQNYPKIWVKKWTHLQKTKLNILAI